MIGHREIYRADQLPVFQNRMFNTSDEALASPKGDVVLVQDMHTGLVFNQAFNPELMDYGPDYQNEQAFSTVFLSHLDEVTSIIHRHLQGKTLVEVGCGKGYFLEHLHSSGFDITGFDPAYEGANPKILKELFHQRIGMAADGIVLRHVLEHIPDPVGFLSKIREVNGNSGKIYIEVPCFDWIAQHRAWFDIFYEHVNYFRLNDFKRMFGIIQEGGHVFGGQYLYVVADLTTLRVPKYADDCRADLPPDFLENVRHHAEALKKRSMGRSAILGGASKGVIFALFMQRAGAPVDIVIDINPAKQGKYLAGSGLRIHSPEEAIALLIPGTDVFVMNSIYLLEIIERSGNQFNYLEIDREII